MKRRASLLALAALAATPLAHAQQARQVVRIGLLCQVKCGRAQDPFLNALRELGWVEGRNLGVDRVAGNGGDAKELARAASELAARKPDLIFAVAPPASLAASKATASIPIVFTAVANPVKVGLVKSLAHPGGNATGLATVPGGNIVGKQFALMKEILPRATRAALLINPDNASHRDYVANVVVSTEAATRLRIGVYEARSGDAIEPAIVKAVHDGVELLVQMGDVVLDSVPERIPQLALRARLPSAYLWAFDVQAGGLISYGPDLNYLLGRGPAGYADRILRGAKPADLPVEQASSFELTVNLRTAKALGLTISQSILLRADKVIE